MMIKIFIHNSINIPPLPTSAFFYYYQIHIRNCVYTSAFIQFFFVFIFFLFVLVCRASKREKRNETVDEKNRERHSLEGTRWENKADKEYNLFKSLIQHSRTSLHIFIYVCINSMQLF